MPSSPLKGQESAYIMKTQFKDLSVKLQAIVQPGFTSRKIAQEFRQANQSISKISSMRKHYDNRHAGRIPDDLHGCFNVLEKKNTTTSLIDSLMICYSLNNYDRVVQSDSIRANYLCKLITLDSYLLLKSHI